MGGELGGIQANPFSTWIAQPIQTHHAIHPFVFGRLLMS